MAQVGTPPGGGGEVMVDPTLRRFRGSAKISDYEVMKEKLGEGTFGVVSKGRSKRNGGLYALKKILMHNEKEGFPITALREVKLLKMLSHPNILRLEEMVVERQQVDNKGKNGRMRATLYTATPYMEHDLSGMLTNPDIRFAEAQIKCYMLQLLEGLRYLHDSHILHRDMKAANILISNRGLLQIADFGLARHYEGPTPHAGRGNGEAVRDYTSLVVTRWYRPPELLLTLKRYTPAIDMWGVGCVFAEMFERKPILEGRTDIDQCIRIFQLIGSPNDQSMPGWSELPGCEGRKEWPDSKGDIDKRFGPRLHPKGLDLLKQLLCLDWRKRINSIDALQHEYFKVQPLPARPEDLPQYEDSHELDARRRGHEKQRALPPAPAGGTVGMGPDEWNGSAPMNYQNGFGYNDRQRGYGRDRGGGYPPRGYEDRRGPPPDARSRELSWRQDRERDRGRGPPPNGHHLPGRPANLPQRPDATGREPAPPAGAARSNVDTYIPSYSAAQAGDRPPPREGFDRGRGGRENTYRDPDAPIQRPRDREGNGRDERGQRNTRSRSPDRDGRQRESDARRERLQNRERDLYRR